MQQLFPSNLTCIIACTTKACHNPIVLHCENEDVYIISLDLKATQLVMLNAVNCGY